MKNTKMRCRVAIPLMLFMLILLITTLLVVISNTSMNNVHAAQNPTFIQVHFDGNGGTQTTPHNGFVWAIKGSNISPAQAPSYQMDGMQFVGWSPVRIPPGQEITDKDKLTRMMKLNYYLMGTAISANSTELAPGHWQAVTRYAVWADARYEVRFELNGGRLEHGALAISVAPGIRPLAPFVYRPGYVLYAWESHTAIGGERLFPVPTPLPPQPAHAMVFMAVWRSLNPRPISRPVYCYSGYRLLYLPSMGNMVFTSRGVPALTHDGEIMTFNEDTGELTDELRRRVALVETTLAGNRHYVINYGVRGLASLNQNDTLYLVRLMANTSANRGHARHILLRRVRRSGFINDGWSFVGMPRYDYTDIWGNPIRTRYLTAPEPLFSLPLPGLPRVDFFLRAGVYGRQMPRWGQVRDLLVEIRRLEDDYGIDLNIPGSIRSDTRYDLGRRMRITYGTGQLMDTINAPIICNLARPLIRDNNGDYIDFFGNRVPTRTIGTHRYLLDQSGERVRSVTQIALENNYTLVFSWIWDTRGFRLTIPSRRYVISARPFEYRVYDMNGVRLCDRPYYIPPDDSTLAENDARQRYPDLFAGHNWWNRLPPWLFVPLDNLRQLVGLPDNGWGWIGTIALGSVIGFVGLVVGVLMLVGFILLMSVIGPLIAPALPVIGSAVTAFLKMLVSGIVVIITAPVSMFGGGKEKSKNNAYNLPQYTNKNNHYQ